MSTETIETDPFWVSVESAAIKVREFLDTSADAAGDPLHVFAGTMIGLRSFMETAPFTRPATFQALLEALDSCIEDMRFNLR